MSQEDDFKSPAGVLSSAIKAVPAVKYALGIGGILAVIAIAVGFGTDLRSLVFGSVIMFVLMTLLVIFASLSGQTKASFRIPAVILTWFSLLLMMTTAVSLFSSLFVGWPLDLRKVLGQVTEKTAASQPAGDSANKPQTTPGVSERPVTTSQSGQQDVSSKAEDSDAANTSKSRSNPDQHQYSAQKQTPTNKIQSETPDFDPPIDGHNLSIEKEGDEELRLAIGNQACLETNCQDFGNGREEYAQSVVDHLTQARTKWKAALTERGSDHTVSRIKAKLLSAEFDCNFEAPCIATEANASHLSWYYQSSPKEVVGHLP